MAYTIDATALERLVSVYGVRADGARHRDVETVYRTVAIEIAHAIEEGRQDLILAETRRNASEPAQKDGVVLLPPGGIALDEIEKQAILAALDMEQWVQARAAALLRISPRVMNHKLQVHGIGRPCDTDAA